ncbi:hypothetical protein [Streptomyces sp. BE147]|uniref:DUF7144 family membrane protein n=1 Tax=unclassified Streptomyces TaxID=2593676 RepID=UPI002E78936D|nr:hypothetical protein [Streptomyces sp. BE147]MEE1735289.1 hypothetical protein [Streptomyces sp. BE147]
MSNAAQQHRTPPSTTNSWATGGLVFAGVLMLVEGILGIFQGIAAIAEDDVYTRFGDYVFKFNLTGWGWIHLILGVVLFITGFGLLKESAWARGLGIGLAALSIIANFMFLPYQPIWALVVIAIGVFVIWSLSTVEPHGKI